MSVLVFGPYPPSPGYEAEETFSFVRALVADGTEVVVASPVPSAAHVHVDPGSPRGGIRLRQMVAGRDRVIMRLDASGLQSSSDSARLRPGRLALGSAIRRAKRVELIIDRVPVDVSRSWVSSIVGPAAAVVVATDAERDALVGAGAIAERVEVRSRPPAGRGHRGAQASWSGSSREALQRDVRRRAAARRSQAEPDGGPDRSGPTAPLREIAPLGHATPTSPKPGVAYVKRLVRKLVAWQLDPIIQHVNRLHQATVASVDRLSDQENKRS